MSSNIDLYQDIVRSLVTKNTCMELMSDLVSFKDSRYVMNSSNIAAEFLKINSKYGDVLSSGFAKDAPAADIYQFVDDLLNYMSLLETVEITVAFHPTFAYLQDLYDWFFSTLRFPFCLSVETDFDICGGLTLSYKGSYIDLSLKKTITDYLNSKRQYVLSEL